MAADAGQSARSVAQRLFDEPHAFEFTQAVRLFELLRRDAVPLGTGLDPRAEALGSPARSGRCSRPARSVPLRAAPPHSLALDTAPDADHARPQPQLQVNGFALGGPEGPLPDAYQEWLQDRLRNKDTSAAAFLDLFQHRLLALLYRAQRKFRVADPFLAPQHSPADIILRGIAGLQLRAHDHAVPEAGIDIRAVLSRAGLFANRRRSLAGFDVLASHHFGLQIRSAPFAGRLAGAAGGKPHAHRQKRPQSRARRRRGGRHGASGTNTAASRSASAR